MTPSVKHIEGRHLTATDKATILQCIEHMRDLIKKGQKPNLIGFIGRKRSPKQFRIIPYPGELHAYTVDIQAREKDDWGRSQVRKSSHVVRVTGVDPLPWPARDPEAILRATWTAEGVPVERQNEIINQTKQIARAGIKFMPVQLALEL